jgi:hypothetical protein
MPPFPCFFQTLVECLHTICRGCAALEEAEGAEGVYKCPFCAQKCETPAKDLFVDVATVAEALQEQEEMARNGGGGGGGSGSGDIVELKAPDCGVCEEETATKCVPSSALLVMFFK